MTAVSVAGAVPDFATALTFDARPTGGDWAVLRQCIRDVNQSASELPGRNSARGDKA